MEKTGRNGFGLKGIEADRSRMDWFFGPDVSGFASEETTWDTLF
jgi:hypothetical protein